MLQPIFLISGIAILLIIGSAMFVVHANTAHSEFTFNNKTHAFTYVATTPQEWDSGLMNKTVGNNTFELFVFTKPAIYPFWMKNTYYPLDIIWINGSSVVYIAHAVPCASYDPGQSDCALYNTQYTADYVIEASSGFANRSGLRIGDAVSIVGK